MYGSDFAHSNVNTVYNQASDPSQWTDVDLDIWGEEFDKES